MLELLDRIETLYKAKGWTAKQFGLEIGLKKSPMNDWRDSKATPTLEQAYKICEIFEVNPDWLLTGKGEMFATEKQGRLVVMENQILVPVYKHITACAGKGSDNSYVEGELEQYLPLPAEKLGVRDDKKIYGMHVEGNSMAAADIPDGSIAVIRITDDFFYAERGDPCHVKYERDGFEVDAIKFYYPKKDGSSVTLRSAEGSGIPPFEFDREDLEMRNPFVCGVVVGVVEFYKPQKGR